MKFIENNNNQNEGQDEIPLFRNDGNVDLLKAENGFENITDNKQTEKVAEPQRGAITTPEELNVSSQIAEEKVEEVILNDLGNLTQNVEPNKIVPDIQPNIASTVVAPKKKKSKTLAILFVIVLLFVGVIAIYYFVFLAPDKVLQKNILKLFAEENVYETKISNYLDISTISAKGNIAFDSTIKSQASLKGYNIDYDITYDKENEKVNSSISLLNTSKDSLLKLNYLYENNIIYLDADGITPKVIKISSKKYTDGIIDKEKKVEDVDYNYVLNVVGNAVFNSFDKTKMNKTITYSEAYDKALAIKVIYNIDKQEINNLINSITKALIEDEKCIQEISKIIGLSEEDVKSELKLIPDEYKDKYDDTTLIIYSNIFSGQVMKFDVINDRITINYLNDGSVRQAVVTTKGEYTYSTEINYNENEQSFSINKTSTEGKIANNSELIINKNKNVFNVGVTYKPDNSKPDEKMTLAISGTIKKNVEFNPMDTSGATSIGNMTKEEIDGMLKSFYEFLSKIGYSTIGL